MRAWTPLLALLAACTPSPALPPPGTSQPVVIHLWSAEDQPPSRFVVQRMVQEGVRLDRLLLEGVSARLVDRDLDWALSAPRGSWRTSEDRLLLDGPVHLAGTWQGSPLLGRAARASWQRRGQAVELHDLELWSRGQRLYAPLLVIHRQRQIEAPRGIRSEPLPAHAELLLATLPVPLPTFIPPVDDAGPRRAPASGARR
ncbi:MAG: hypothetical protein RMM29_00320 [Planctomycetota bacterium]|nr:hypothetical protein [Planctomycetota bacterium]